MTAPWIGVDPGWAGTGVVLRQGRTLLWWTQVTRETDEDVITGRGVQVGADYLLRVTDAVTAAEAHWLALGGPIAPRTAVEGITAPTGHIKRTDGTARLTNPQHALGAAIVLGAVIHHRPRCIVIPQATRGGQHGQQLLATYPPELVTTAERRHGINRPARRTPGLKDARSAWDVAGEAPAFDRITISRDRLGAALRKAATR